MSNTREEPRTSTRPEISSNLQEPNVPLPQCENGFQEGNRCKEDCPTCNLSVGRFYKNTTYYTKNVITEVVINPGKRMTKLPIRYRDYDISDESELPIKQRNTEVCGAERTRLQRGARAEEAILEEAADDSLDTNVLEDVEMEVVADEPMTENSLETPQTIKDKMDDVPSTSTATLSNPPEDSEGLEGNFHSIVDMIKDLLSKMKLPETTLPKELDNVDQLKPDESFKKIHKVYDHLLTQNIEGKYKEIIDQLYSETKTTLKTMKMCCAEPYNTPQHGRLTCSKKPNCQNITPGAITYEYQNSKKHIRICQQHYGEMKSSAIINGVPKRKLKQTSAEKISQEPLVKCKNCTSYHHEACREWSILTESRTCPCRREQDLTSDISARLLKNTPCADFIEKFVNEKHPNRDIIIREVCSKEVNYLETREGKEMEERFKYHFKVPNHAYRYRMLVAYLKHDGTEHLFYVMSIKEYPETGYTSIDYLDSVKYIFFGERTSVYEDIILSYYDFATSLGYTMAHIWVCPPDDHEDFFFNVHPEKEDFVKQEDKENKKEQKEVREQETPLNFLMKWYKTRLNNGKENGPVQDYSNSKELNIEDMETAEEIFTSLVFSGYWMEMISNHVKDYRKVNGEFLEYLKKALSKDAVETSDRLLYMDLKPSRASKAPEEVEIIMEVTASREAWMGVMDDNKWEFLNLRKSRYASMKLIQRMLMEQEGRDCDADNKWTHV